MSVTIKTADGKPQFNWPVLILYLVIVIVLGVLGGYSLSLGPNGTTFATSVVTALTTIAGFAVGANVTKQ